MTRGVGIPSQLEWWSLTVPSILALVLLVPHCFFFHPCHVLRLWVSGRLLGWSVTRESTGDLSVLFLFFHVVMIGHHEERYQSPSLGRESECECFSKADRWEVLRKSRREAANERVIPALGQSTVRTPTRNPQ